MLHLPSPDNARRLRDFFRESNYSKNGLREIIRTNEVPSHARRNLPRLLDVTREVSRLHTLVRLFSVGAAVEAEVARRWIPDWVVRLCLEAGLLSGDGNRLVPAATILPFSNLLLATDLALDISCSSAPDVVLGINASTWMLYHFTVRTHSHATLDLGAGCGAQALAAAAHSDHVVAADVNARATEFARFNARLNGFENVECLTGDTFAPVAGRRFDLIVSNPPFFITPAVEHLYCDNAMDLDQYCRRVVREAPAHLAEGGCLQLMCEWAQIDGQPWEERVAEWFEATGCDAWVLRYSSYDPSKYAQDRIRETTPPSVEGDAASYSRWMDYYRAHRVEAIHGGFIAMRRRPGRNWVRIDDLPGAVNDPFGASILHGFASQDRLESNSSEERLPATRPRLSPDAQLDQRLRHSGGQWRLESLELVMTGGLPFRQPLQPMVAEFLTLLDGSRTMADAIREIAEKVDANPEDVRRECLAVVRRLIGRGFVVL